MAYSNLYARFYVVRRQLAANLSIIWRLSSNRWYFLTIALVQSVAWLQAFFIKSNLTGDFLVLHYNIDFGVDLVGSPERIFLYPLFGFEIFLLNLLILMAFSNRSEFRVFSHLLFGTTVFFGLLLNLALFFIYLINFR